VIPLIVGTVLSLGALSFVLYPLFRTGQLGAQPARVDSRDTDDAARNPALEALREIEFDRETGKLSDADYTALRAEYTQRAVAVMRAGDAISCVTCGPRPESDALFCSNCGARLAA
jgi:cytochrome c-type biogenesis protein CcmI